MSRGDCATAFSRYAMNAANSRDRYCILQDAFEFSRINFFDIPNDDQTNLCWRVDFLGGLVKRLTIFDNYLLLLYFFDKLVFNDAPNSVNTTFPMWGCKIVPLDVNEWRSASQGRAATMNLFLNGLAGPHSRH